MRIQCNALTNKLLREARDVQFNCKERRDDCLEEGIFVKAKVNYVDTVSVRIILAIKIAF